VSGLRIVMTSYYMPSDSKIGVGHQVHALANALSRRGNEVTVVTPCPPTAGAEYRTRQVPLTGSMRTFRFAFVLRRLDLSGTDVFHAHGDDYWMWRRRPAAHIRTMHGSCFEEARRIAGVKEKVRMLALGLSEVLASMVADRTVLVSGATRRWMPWVKTVIPNGVDLTVFTGREPKSPHPTVLFVGTYEGRKRGKLLVDAFLKSVAPVLPEAELWMVTQDAPELPDSVVVLGRLDEPELAERYGQAWLFCLPSIYEGFGIPYVEAMASATAVLASPNPGALEVSSGGTAAAVVEDEQLGPALLRLLQEANERDLLVRAGSEAVKRFDLEVVADAYEQLYREALGGRR